MKKINTLSLGFAFAGCFLGAGFVSGQEIWQFFGAFGIMGILGIVLTFLLHFLFGIILIRLIHNTKIAEMDKIVVWKDIPVLRNVVGGITAFFMFSILVIMSAGTGALLNRIFAIPNVFGCGIFCLLVAVASMRGVDGMVSALSKLVPFMIAGAVLIGIFSVYKGDFDISVNPVNNNVLLQNWVFSAFTYASHNLFCTIGILAPMTVRIENKAVVKGIGFGSLILLLIAFSVLFGVLANVDVANTELPMLELAYNVSSVFGVVYAFLLLFGMFGTSLSSIVGVAEYGEQKSKWILNNKKILIIILCVTGWICSLFGFGDLIGIVYPISGYFGFAVNLAVIINYIRTKNGEKLL